MILVPSIKRIAARVTAAAMAAVTLMTSVAYADEPYDGYNYDWWGDPVPSQNGYVVDKVITGADIGVGTLSEPSDMFFPTSATCILPIRHTSQQAVLIAQREGSSPPMRTSSSSLLLNPSISPESRTGST